MACVIEIAFAAAAVVLAAVSLGIAVYNRGEHKGFEEGREIGWMEGYEEAIDDIYEMYFVKDCGNEENQKEE